MITKDSSGNIIINGKESVQLFVLLQLKYRLRLEKVGLKSSGQSALSIIKQRFGLKGNRESITQQFEKILEEAKSIHTQNQSEEIAKESASNN